MISRKEDNRGGGSTGRRPLVISGPNRQMLHDISDSLSHILGGKPDAEPEVTGKSNVQIKPELSQSTPNLLEKSNNVTRDGYNKMALQTIRNKLRPFQTDRTDDSNNTFNSTSSQGSEDGDVRLHDDTQEITSRLAKQSLDKGRNGIRIGPGHNPYSKPVKRRPSFEKNYGNGTNNNSERSDSPLTQPRVLTFNNDPNLAVGQGIGTRQITPSPIVNGDQTPPPVPPRAPIITSQRSQTPPSEAQQLVPDSSSNGGHQLPVLLQPPTVITPAGQAIKSVTQNHPKYIAYSQHQIPQPSKQQQSPSGSGPVTPSRGMSPVSTARQPVIVQHASHPISQHFPVQNHNGSVASTRVTTSSGPNITIQYKQPPPPYNQTHTRTNPTIVHIKGTNNEHKLTSSGVPEYTTQIKVDSSSVSTSGSDSVQINLPQKTGTASPLHTQLWNAVQQPTGIVMQSVKSREVKKPLLQTATGPMPSSPSVQSQAPNYISSYKAHITSPNHTGIPTQIPTNTVGDVQIQITRHPQYTPEQIAQLQGRRQIKIHIHNGGHGPHYAHGVHGHGDIFQRSASDTPTSTPRSESPISRQLNQSPMSILSTTSTPSTNSDIPDKPPPPYPGRIQIVQPIPQKYPHSTQIHHHQQHINQSLALHPPPTQQGFTPLPHSQPHQFTSHCDSPQPPLPPRVPLQIKQVTENSDIPPVPPPPTTKPSSNPQPNSQQINGANKQNHEQNDETDETMSTVSDTSSTQEKTRCTSPMPERKPESKENDRMWRDCRLRNCTPQAFKFYMEQHVENLLKSYKERLHRRIQLEREMSKVGLSEEAQKQMRRMLCQKESNYIRLKRARMDKCMFEKITVLGVGAFGEVTLVRKRDVGHLYAMKTLLKSDVLKRNQVAHVKAERDILAEADNEWVVKLYYSFQDRDCLYFVMDYVPGGDLMNLLIKFGVFKEPLAVFYIAELVLAIESVHRMGFTHRDIKPDNILIDKDGHIKLTDFGLCTGFRWTHNSMYYQKVGSHPRQDSMDVSCAGVEPECQCNEILKPLERRRQRERHRCLAHSLVGTPNYIAPEVLLRQGYTSCCDWWSVGVILYEMLVGQPPFYATTPSETQWKVIHWDKTLKIPPEANLTEPAADLIISLCCGPNERLGCNGAGEIKKHSFFEHTSFDGLRKSTPPWKPKLSHAMDTSNFDEIITDKMGDSDDETKKPDHPVNGKHPEHAFFEFTFRRFFDDGGHPYPTINDEHKETDKSTAKDSSAPVYV